MNFKFYLFLLTCVMVLIACGGSEEDVVQVDVDTPVVERAEEEPAVEPTAATAVTIEEQEEPPVEVIAENDEPVVEVEPEVEEPAAEAEPIQDEIVDISALNVSNEGLTSYTIEVEMSFFIADEPENNQTIIIHGATDLIKNASQFDMQTRSYSDEGELEQAMTVTQVGGETYTVLGEIGCMQIPQMEGVDDPVSELQDTQEMLKNLQNVKRVRPNVTINGVETIHYVFDESIVAADGEDGLVNMSGELFLSVDDRYVIKMTMQGAPENISIDLEEATAFDAFEYELNMTSFNQPVEVSLPAECAAGGGSGGGTALPRPEDVTALTSMAGIETYQTSMSPAEVSAFYDEALLGAGWTNDTDGEEIEGMAIRSYSKGGETIELVVTIQEGVTMVIVVSEGAE